jgi:RHS repeat-associated protein
MDLGGRLDGAVEAPPADGALPDAAPDGAAIDAEPVPDMAVDAEPVPDAAVDAAPGCATLADCGPEEACEAGACVPRCVPEGCGDGHCDESWVCVDGEGCAGDASCAPGSWCGEDGACHDGCRQSPDSCPDGERCDETHACVPGCEPQPELCNGRDDNCDGEVDEGLNLGEACQTGPGACGLPGVRACNDAFEVVCEGPLGEGSEETCNGIDDDCDGVIDDGLGLGEACTAGQGACAAAGVAVCVDGAVGCDAVAGVPSRDVCNGVDDNCDGAIDEGFGVGEPCEAGAGVCLSAGVWRCSPEGGATCDAPPAVGGPEQCNGVDDDCDGQVDNDLGGGACETGLPGVCGGGQRSCEGGELRCWPAVEASPEQCNGLDDDCDGQIDNDTGTVSCGVGVCQRDLPACVDGGAPACDPLVGAQAQELCNGLDDDCDGQIDEDALGDGEACGAGMGACQRAGVRACIDGAQICDAVPGQPEPEDCDGIDDDCDGLVDEGAFAEGARCDVGVGACVAQGQPVCVGGQMVCEGEPGAPVAEQCNGVDDNCDGTTDEGFGEPCGVGQCHHILAACDGGAPAVCDPLQGAELERCDGVDNDCDGEIDEGIVGLGAACQAGQGLCELAGLTACVDGAEQCVADPAQRPDEVCNGLDDDCDGLTDETPVDEGEACATGRGACESLGALRCMAGNLTCDAVAGLPVAELCNGEDDDCNGSVDDGLGTQACGVGACARQLPVCADGAPVACDPLVGAGAEICNGLDDNCDGAVDEGTGGAACALGVGVCHAEGAEACLDGALVCDAARIQPRDEICNALDDNCDGQTDEGLGLGDACAVGVGACAVEGVLGCDDAGGTACQAVAEAPGAEQCNGLDDDCDGVVDNGTVGRACQTDQPGVCAAGQTTCVGGAAGCEPIAQAAAEICDGLDNDCDGVVDNGLGQVDCGVGVCARQLAACTDGAPTACDAQQGAVAEICDGLDNDCDGQADDGLGGDVCEAGVGACLAAGRTTCVDGAMGCDAAVGQPGVELCNGADDDCDGVIDNAPTDVGPCAAGVGACSRAAQTVCAGGVLSCPAVAGAPEDETCNGLDDNCDGTIDEGFGSVICGVGACEHAVLNCDNGEAPACDPMEGAGAELCNGIDDDCDGTVDEDAPGGGDNCAVGVGECHIVALTTCIDGVIGCPAVPLEPTPERCNGFDDDCDGVIDNAVDRVGTRCVLGRGACGREGVIQCNEGTLACSVSAADPIPEICNGLDDDCDGLIDEEIAATHCGVGTCARAVVGCVDGVAPACEPFAPRAEICDGLDNNCDGEIDEGIADVECGLGVCARTVPRCVDGAINACPPQQGASDEICDGLDNDCDGHVDDGVPPQICTRGLGICERQDFEQCVQGQWNCLAEAADVAVAETCNNRDDDCDGTVDNNTPEAGQQCERGVGACRNVRITSCEEGFVVCPAVAGDAVEDICNDLDDDCDGTTDEVGPDCDNNGQGDDCDVLDGAADCNDNGIPDSCDIAELRSGDCNGNTIPDECNGDGDGCVPDNVAPVIDLFLQGTVVNSGTTIQVIVRYTEEGSGVDQVGLTLDGQPVVLDQFNQAFVELNQPGFQTFVATVSDQAGNVGEQTRQVRVLDPTDGDRPVIQIHTPNNGANVFANVVFNISVNDPTLTDWWLTWGPDINPDEQEIARGVAAVNAADVAVIDIGGLQAAVYRFRLWGKDVNGRRARIEGTFIVPDCAPGPEICNYTDDDCDGVADNGVVGLGAPCQHGVGECLRAGNGVCAQDGTVMCDAAPGFEQIEQCDGLDNDCDGSVDERWPVGQVCHLGEGACRRAGEVVCTADTTAALCNAVPADPGVEACNGVDDDCDGQIDEGIRGCGIDTPPTVAIVRPIDDVPEPGPVTIEVATSDDFGISAVTLTVDGADVPVDAQGIAQIADLRAGRYDVVATATDDEGQVSTTSIVLWVNDPIDQFNPFVQIDAPRPDHVIALPFDVRGTAADETLVEWTLTLVAPEGGPAPVELARGTQEIGNDVLANIDPQAMPNGVWHLVLWAVDANHRASSTTTRVRIEGCIPVPEICDGADQDCDHVADNGLANCAGDVTPPQVQLTWSGDTANLGELYQVAVFATDDIWVDRRAVVINGVEQPAEEGVLIDVPLLAAGRLYLEGRAWDTAGNLGSAPLMVRVMDPADADAPVIAVIQPAAGDPVDGPVAILGSIIDANPWSWSVYLGTPANPEQVLLAEGEENIDGVLGEFDAGALPDGDIMIRVIAEDANGRARRLDWPLRVRPCEPEPDVCDGRDNDCDGEADEDFVDLGQPCEAGVGECRAVGELVCGATGQFTVCGAVPREPQPERCDALDRDCNGPTTNGFEVGRLCEVGVGACVRAGRTICAADGADVTCDVAPGEPAAEICDHIDNNCDGEIDEGFAQVECGVGACFRLIGACEGAAACDPLEGAQPELCNGVDDDCDGVIDDSPQDAGAACEAGLGICRRVGEMVCAEGAVSCNVVAAEPGAEICDTLDNDCDGAVDENFVCPDETDPVVVVNVAPDPADVGEAVTVTVQASDDRAPPTVVVTANGAPVALNPAGQGIVVPDAVGQMVIRVVVTDEAGNAVIKEVSLLVRDPNDVTRPHISLTGPDTDSELLGAVAVTGTVRDAQLVSWTLTHAPESAPNNRVVFASGANVVEDGELATLNTGAMAFGSHRIRLTAVDAGGNEVYLERQIMVGETARPGQLSFCVDDVNIPRTGLPIMVRRCYDSMNAGGSRDFGPGWTMTMTNGYVTHNRPVEKGWAFESVCLRELLGGCISFSCDIAEGRRHMTVAFAGGDQFYRFIPEIVNQSRLQNTCAGNIRWVPAQGTPAGWNLYQRDDDRVWQIGNEEEMYYEFTWDRYQPRAFELRGPLGERIGFVKGTGIDYYIDANGNHLYLDDDGMTDRNDVGVHFERDAFGRIARITDPAGGVIEYTYENGVLTGVRDRAGHTTQYRYQGHLITEIVAPDGEIIAANTFDDDGRWTGATNAMGEGVAMEYDMDQQVQRVRDGNGEINTYTWDVLGNVTRWEDPLGNATLYAYDEDGDEVQRTNPLGQLTLIESDADGNQLGYSMPNGGQVRSEVNDEGRPTVIHLPDGSTQTMVYGRDVLPMAMRSEDGALIELSATDDGELREIQGPMGTRTVYDRANGQVTRRRVYDADGTVLGDMRYEYDAIGYLRTTHHGTVTADGTVWQSTSYRRDGEGRVLEISDALGVQQTNTYDANGRMLTQTDGLGRTTRYTYDRAGRLTLRQYADGTDMRWTHDGVGRVLTELDRAGRTTRFVYDAAGRRTEVQYPDGAVTQVRYDALGRVVAEVDATGAEVQYVFAADQNGPYPSTVIAPDGSETHYEYDLMGRRVAMVDALGRRWTYQYSSAGRLLEVVHPGGALVTQRYDLGGRLLARTDEQGRETTWVYDGIGRILEVHDALDGVSQYSWSAAGGMASMTDRNGQVTQFEYDARGRRHARVLPDGARETLSYDLADRRIGRTDFRGWETTYQYDASDNLVRILPDQRSGSGAVGFTHDAVGNVVQVVEPVGVSQYAYDARDRMIQHASPAGQVDYTRDPVGRITEIRTDAGALHSFAYDGSGRLTTVGSPAGQFDYTFDAVGNTSSLTAVVPGVRSSYVYDARNRLTQMAVVNGADDPLLGYAYTLSPTGRRTQVTELGGRQVNYSYDAIERLVREAISLPVGAAGPVGFSAYTLDPVGNRTRLESTIEGLANGQFTYNARDQREDRQYDANGNTTGANNHQDQFDAFDRLVVRDGQVTLQYDHAGRLVQRAVGDEVTRFVTAIEHPSGWSQLLEERVDGAVVRSYVHGLAPLAQIDAAVHYLLADGSGAVRALADAQGVITDRFTYDAFGVQLAHTGDTSTPYGFDGQYREASLGLYALRARYYEAESGQFWTMDAFEGAVDDPTSMHKYLYANADPVNLRDPSGYFSMGSMMTGISISISMGNAAYGSYTSNVHMSFGRRISTAIGESLLAGMLQYFSGKVKMGGKVMQFLADVVYGTVADVAGKLYANYVSGQGLGLTEGQWRDLYMAPAKAAVGALFGAATPKGASDALDNIDVSKIWKKTPFRSFGIYLTGLHVLKDAVVNRLKNCADALNGDANAMKICMSIPYN